MTDNDEQIEFWNGPGARRWVKYQAQLDSMLAPFGRLVLDAAAVQPGARVVDVGCGCGATSLSLAEAVGPEGAVLGVDVSTPMLEVASRRAREGGLPNARFVVADASTHRFDGSFDLVFSRFGIMFFADPVAAFRNLATALRSGGRLTFICWGPVAENPWFSVPMTAAGTVISLPEPTPPGAPGPFAFADRGRLRTILESAGFVDVAITPATPTYVLGPDPETAATNAVETGPVARLLLDVDEPTRQRVRGAICEAIAPYQSPSGVVIASSAWIVGARKD
jgi:SAM-dependent methyltransferase